ncbi:MAG: protein-glutamate O-methyltransferase CheR [Leptospirales bacterium]
MEGNSPVFTINNIVLTERELKKFQQLVYEWAGIHMSDAKSSLIAGRLLKRLRFYKLETYQEYIDIVLDSQYQEEKQIMVNLLTTNETYFFREDAHLEYLNDIIIPNIDTKYGTFRVWSAAASSGQEAYSISMILADSLKNNTWEIFGSDINEAVLKKAREGLYPIEAAQKIPQQYLKKYCLKGVRSQEGKFTVIDELKRHIRFEKFNLNEPFSDIGFFDVIFLRNVMIYFNVETKQKLIDRIINVLKPDGFLIVGHSESLNSLDHNLKTIVPTVYKRK